MTSNFQPKEDVTASPRESVGSPEEAAHSRHDSSESPYQSPWRHHHRSSSGYLPVKETRNAHSEYSNDEGSSQLRINQYLIGQEIGRGSFGAVHMATDQYGNEYAVKEFSKSRLRRRAKSNLLRRPRTGTPGFERGPASPTQSNSSARRTPLSLAGDNPFDLIKEEIAVMKKLHHNNLVSLIEVLDDPEEDSLFMVLEMCKKGVIMKIEVEDDVAPYSEEHCRTWFRDLILGIEYLHAQGVIHRDIKPDNCLLTDDDTLKIVDFGVSEMFEKTSEMRIAKSAGSPAFQAPELCVVKHGDVSGKPADIWSMGVTLYCLRFGRVPFRKAAVLEMYDSILNEDVPIPKACDSVFSDLITRLLEKDPTKRITMTELREHPWVTKDGADPLLPEHENCAELVSPPTASEMNAAITGNMSRVIAVVKAARRFKSLLHRHRPEFMEGILGQASRFVQPPLSMAKSKANSAIQNMQSPLSEEEARRAKGYLEQIGEPENAKLVERINQLPEKIRTVAILSSAHSDDELPSPIGSHNLRKVQTEPPPHQEYPRGHAHDPLQDQIFVNVGTGSSDEDSYEDEEGNYVVCESPSAVEQNVFESAYEDEVEKIFRDKGRRATVYLTRRVEDKMGPLLDKFSENATTAVSSAWDRAEKSGLTDLVKGALETAKRATEKGKGKT